MYKHNEPFYKKLCGPCVMVCFRKMKSTESEKEMAVIVKQTTDYLNGDMTETDSTKQRDSVLSTSDSPTSVSEEKSI